MLQFYCKNCHYQTNIKCNYNKHLKTQKHTNNLLLHNNLGNAILDKNIEHKMNTNEHKMNTNEHKMNTNEHKKNTNNLKTFKCHYCDTLFNTKASMRRHEIHYCKSSNNLKFEIKKVDKEKTQMIKQLEDEKTKLYKQIEMLIEKAGDTNITTTNNIQINSFGHEDMSYITQKMLNRLVVHPNTMIADLVRLTHFHKDHPENKNLKITNIKSKYLKVFSKGKWTLQNKDNVIDNIMTIKSNILEEHFDDKCKEALPDYQQSRFNSFIEVLDEEPSLQKKIKDNIELVIANESN